MVYRFEAENFRGFFIRCKRKKTWQEKIIAFKCKYLLSDCEAKLDMGMEIGEFGLCGQKKIWIAALKFDELCYRKFDKHRILFSTVFVERPRYAFIILWKWMVTIILDFSVTQAKSQSDLFLFCWLCRGTYVSPRISLGDFRISNLLWHQLVPKS